MEAETRQSEAIKVVKWMAENPRIARRLLNVEGCTTPEECIEVIEILEKQSLEYLIPVLFHTVCFDGVMENVWSRLYAEGVSKAWEHVGTGRMLADIKDKIREEIRLKGIKGDA